MKPGGSLRQLDADFSSGVAWRDQRGWKQRKLAQRAGLTPTYGGILEYGGNIPSLPTVLELLKVLGADIADVMRSHLSRSA